MSYFEHTQRDVAEAGEKAKKELAKLIAAILLDADVKAEDPDTYDRTYVMEDLMGRIAATIAPYTNEVFETWQDHRLAYPEMMARDESGLVRPFVSHHAWKTKEVTGTWLARDAESAIMQVLENRRREKAGLERAIRETQMLQTWDGVARHRFQGSFLDKICSAMVQRRGIGTGCGLPPGHQVHDTEV